MTAKASAALCGVVLLQIFAAYRTYEAGYLDMASHQAIIGCILLVVALLPHLPEP